MGFFDKLKNVFKGTRKATRLTNSKSAARREKQQKAMQKRSDAFKATLRKKEKKKQEKLNAEFKKIMNKTNAGRRRDLLGKALAQAKGANREKNVEAGLLKAPMANEFELAFRENVKVLKNGKPASVKFPWEARGSVRKTEKLRTASKKSKVRSLAANPSNWETFSIKPRAITVKSATKKAKKFIPRTNIERELYSLFK
jgi:hypothetical protein